VSRVGPKISTARYDRFVAAALLSLVILLAVGGVMLAIGLTYAMARTLVRPPRMTDGKAMWMVGRLTPADLGLRSSPRSFTVRSPGDEGPITLAAWHLPSEKPNAPLVVLLHGYGDAKVGAIAWSPIFAELGFEQLVIDLRAHGESTGDFTTAGDRERHDVAQAIDQFRTTPRPVLLFGVSLGAAVALGASLLLDGVVGVICESPYASFDRAVRTHATKLLMPLERTRGLVMRWAQAMTRSDFSSTAPLAILPRVPCPVLIFHSGDDPLVSGADRDAITATVRSRGNAADVVHTTPGATHVSGYPTDPAGYAAVVREFVTQSCKTCITSDWSMPTISPPPAT
jgi:uncharacterized protein